jgi:GT2 family glycosyltransferase
MTYPNSSNENVGWTPSSSIDTIDFKPRPILEDMSVVIPTLGRPILEQSLYWIAAGSSWPGCLIIVEQGENPAVQGWVSRLQSLGIVVKHIRSDQRGRSAGINRGLEQVSTCFVAITDDDCFVETDWLANMARHLRANPEAIITGRVEAAGEDVVLVVTSLTPAVYSRPRLKFDSMSGGNLGTSLTVVNKVGLFEEDPCMRTAEDAEWGYRSLRAGVTIHYAPDVCVRHFGWRDMSKRSEQYRTYALSHGGFYGKYIRTGDWFILMRAAVHFMRSLRRWVVGTMSRDTDAAMLGKAYFTNLLPGILAGYSSGTGTRNDRE